MNIKDIIEAWARIRKIDQTIPDDVLDFMKDSAVQALKGSSLQPVVSEEGIEKWFAGEQVNSDKFWQDSPFRTNGDVVELIKLGVKEFAALFSIPSNGMRWVKASERLPDTENGQGVYLRGYKRLKYGVIYKEWVPAQNEYFIQIATDNGETLTSFRNGHEELQFIEWLDESAIPLDTVVYVPASKKDMDEVFHDSQKAILAGWLSSAKGWLKKTTIGEYLK
jgi:hypothetical protein